MHPAIPDQFAHTCSARVAGLAGLTVLDSPDSPDSPDTIWGMDYIRRSVATVCVALLTALTMVAVAPAARAASPVPGAVGSKTLAPHVYAGGGVIGFGAPTLGRPANAFHSVVVAQVANPAATAAAEGYWLASADGDVLAIGNAGFHGSLEALRLQAPIVGMAATPDGKGYWLVALDGGVFALGNAGFYGSMGAVALNEPIVGMAATPDGKGYWLVASDGGLFAFGDAPFLGSMGGSPLVSAITGMAPAHLGQGYWLVAGDGGIFAYGSAGFHGSLGGIVLNDPIVGMAATSSDGGYYLAASDGGVFTAGDAVFRGSLGGGLGGDPRVVPPVSAITLTQDGAGYWLLDPDGFAYDFANPANPSPSALASSIVSVASSQVNPDLVPGYFCNPYGPCVAWCAYFATWVWRQAGVAIPSYGFTGDIYGWAAANTAVLPPTAAALPGDAVLYGTGPSSVNTSEHVGVVVQVWPDGAIVTVEGDAGPAPVGRLAVVINGPYLPGHSAQSNGVPVYAFARP